MIRQCLLSLFSLLLLPASALTGETTDSIDVGGRMIKIPVPAVGFARCDGVDAEWDKVMATMQSANNRVLATYGTQADQDSLRAGKPPEYATNFNVQVIRSLEAKEFGTETFAGIKDQTAKEVKASIANIETEVNKQMASGSREISDQLGVDAALSVSDTAMLGIFQDDSQSLGFTMALKLNVSTPKGTEVAKSVVACIMQPVNGRLLMFYSTRPYSGEDDRKIAESSVKAWAETAFAANPQIKGPPARRSLFDGVGKAGLVGAIAGALVAVFFVVKKKIAG